MYHYQKFEIPASWEWTTLGEIIKLYSGQDFVPEKYNDEKNGIPYIIGASNIQDGNIIVTRWTEYPSVISEYGDLLIVCKGAGVGKMVINNVGKCHIARQIQAIRVYGNTILLDYIQLVLQKGISYVVSQANGLIPGLPRDLLLNFPIPLPPIQEQKRISKTFLNFDATLKCIEQFGSTLSTSIKTIKSKILELAMQGKLVPQDPADEPAADLLRRVNPKARIITDNPHYPQLPDNWIYVSIDDINEYKSRSVNPAVYPEQVFDLYSVPIYPTGEPERLKGQEIGSTKQTVKCGDILLCKINPHLNRVWFIDSDSDHTQIASSEWIVVRPKELYAPFIREYFTSPAFRKMLCSQVSGVGGSLTRAQPSLVKQYLVPIPPYEEQIRIVEHMSKFIENLTDIEVNLTTL